MMERSLRRRLLPSPPPFAEMFTEGTRVLLPSPPPFAEVLTEEGTGLESQRRVPSSVATLRLRSGQASGHGGGSGWRPSLPSPVSTSASLYLRFCVSACLSLLVITLAACGGGGGAPPPPRATLSGTLAYVVSECRATASELTAHQELRVQHGEQAPQTLLEFTVAAAVEAGALCASWGASRSGPSSVDAFPIVRLNISPDGKTIVFEVNDNFSVIAPNQLVSPDQEGMFVMGVDGSGLRRIGPPGREPSFRLAADPSSPLGLGGSTEWWIGFSPDGRTITFIDLGPSCSGVDAAQVFTLDLVTGERRQQTCLEPLQPASPYYPTVFPGNFLDNETIQFSTLSAPEGSAQYTVQTDGSFVLTRRMPVAVPGSQFIPNFIITGPPSNAFGLAVPGLPVNQIPYIQTVVELFMQSGDNLLQLTNFQRSDTSYYIGLLSADRQRVLFEASADPFGTNPNENCQIFSIDVLGTGLRQLTAFDEGVHALGGCVLPEPRGYGCLTALFSVDVHTDTVLWDSPCDPFGQNPNGEQFFVMRSDGTGLRQITNVRGMTTEPDGTVSVELIGPLVYAQQ